MSSSASLQHDQVHRQKSKKDGRFKPKKSSLRNSTHLQVYTHQDNRRHSFNTAIQSSSLTLINQKTRKTFDEVLESELTIRIYSAPNDRNRDFIKFYDFGQSSDDKLNSRINVEDEDEEEEEEEEFQSVKSHQSLPVEVIEPNHQDSNFKSWLNINSPSEIQEPSTPISLRSSQEDQEDESESMETFFSPDTTDFSTIIQTVVPSEQNQISNASQQSLQSDNLSALDFSTPFLDFL